VTDEIIRGTDEDDTTDGSGGNVAVDSPEDE